METSFKRVAIPLSSKPPITYQTKRHSVSIDQTGAISAREAQGKIRSLFEENNAKHNEQNKIALNTSNNDVFILRGDDAHSAKITKENCDELRKENNEEKHNLVQILLQPKKAKKRAAIYFDTTAMQGRKIASVDVDKTEKGRTKIKVKTLDLMA